MTALQEASPWLIVLQTVGYAQDTRPGFVLQNWWRHLGGGLLGIGEVLDTNGFALLIGSVPHCCLIC